MNVWSNVFGQKQVWTGWLSLGSPAIAEITAASGGFDCLVVDDQHGMLDNNVLDQFRAIDAGSKGKTVVLARVHSNHPPAIHKLLDSGAKGIICPMINSAKEAEGFVKECLFPPLGNRSYGPNRTKFGYSGESGPFAFASYANQNVVKLAMIETKCAFTDIDNILKVQHLDGVFVGPNDLSLAMGFDTMPSPSAIESESTKCVLNILHNARLWKKKVGIWSPDSETALGWKSLGFDFVVAGCDSGWFNDGLKGKGIQK